MVSPNRGKRRLAAMTRRVDSRVKFDSQFDTQSGKSRQTRADESDTIVVRFEYENDPGGLWRTT